jgi:hypothetical protein
VVLRGSVRNEIGTLVGIELQLQWCREPPNDIIDIYLVSILDFFNLIQYEFGNILLQKH